MKISQISNNNIRLNILHKNELCKKTSIQQNITDLKNMPVYYSPSFCAKTNAKKLEYIGEDNFPNLEILTSYKTAIENGEDVLLCHIHRDFYSQLLSCETLDDAKQIYPEFCDVIDASKLPEKEYKGPLKRIAQGKLEGVNLENLSLEILKRHYGQSLGHTKKESYWGIVPQANKDLFSKLNIKTLNREYLTTITTETPERSAFYSQQFQKLWQDAEYRQGRTEDSKKRWERPEFRQMRAESLKKQWADPAKREAQAEVMKKRIAQEGFAEKRIAGIKKGWADPERRVELTELIRQSSLIRWSDPQQREKMSAFMLEKWQDPEYRQHMAIYSDALKLAWEMHPEISEKMSEIATEFPCLGIILTKSQAGTALSEGEKALLMAYYKKCNQEMPNFTLIVAQTQKEILALRDQEQSEDE